MKLKPNKSYKSEKYVLPGLLSFFVLTLGQFEKGQVKWGLTLWLWFIMGNSLIIALSEVLISFTTITIVIFNLFIWIYQIYDAYNAPLND